MKPAGFLFEDLRGKTLLITGITRGIGKAMLPGLLGQGLRILAISRGQEEMEAVRDQLGVDSSRLRLFDCDLSAAGAVRETARAVLETGWPVDAILHNAAIDPRQAFEKSDEAFWQAVFQVNLFAAVELTRLLLPLVRKSPQGRILFTGSVVMEWGTAYLSAYAASKGALAALTRSLAHELKGTGITVNCVLPGAIRVEKENASPESDQRVIACQSVPRRLEPRDLLGPVCLLLSEAGGGITAQTLTVDGGVMNWLADPGAQEEYLAP